MKKILLVDDEVDVREVLKKKFEQNGYSVTTVASGKWAIDVCRESKPDIVLLDIAMPELNGYQICERLKNDKDTCGAAVLFITGKDLDPDGVTQRCKELGAVGYLPKPSTFEEIFKKVKEIIG